MFWIVQIEGEGSATVWHNGKMLNAVLDGSADCDDRQPLCSGVKEQRAIRQWWLKVRNSRGRIGWVRADWNFIDGSCGVPRGR